MTVIRSDLPKKTKQYFYDLENYLDTKLYFYGSVNRNDYIHGKSDIDIAVFTDNEQEMIAKLQHFLKVKKDAFEQLIWKIHGRIIYGYKIKCDKYNDLKCEISIYNNEFKNFLLKEFYRDTVLPFHIWFLLLILKTIYYKLGLITSKTYSYCKRIIYNHFLFKDKSDAIFYLMKPTLY